MYSVLEVKSQRKNKKSIFAGPSSQIKGGEVIQRAWDLVAPHYFGAKSCNLYNPIPFHIHVSIRAQSVSTYCPMKHTVLFFSPAVLYTGS